MCTIDTSNACVAVSSAVCSARISVCDGDTDLLLQLLRLTLLLRTPASSTLVALVSLRLAQCVH
jgi:hypothetical protein